MLHIELISKLQFSHVSEQIVVVMLTLLRLDSVPVVTPKVYRRQNDSPVVLAFVLGFRQEGG
jgi:hypothetical protein